MISRDYCNSSLLTICLFAVLAGDHFVSFCFWLAAGIKRFAVNIINIVVYSVLDATFLSIANHCQQLFLNTLIKSY